MRYVYLLSDHGEHGSEHVRATLNRNLLHPMLVSFWDRRERECKTKVEMEAWLAWIRNTIDEALPRLQELLALSDDVLVNDGDPHNLQGGWGGVQLHVIPLETSSPWVYHDE
jgi:hypothetical protein